MIVPENHSQLYDMLQRRYGIGDGPEQHEEPYFKIRGREIAKLKATMKRRNVSLDAMALNLWYAEQQNIPIRAVWQLCELTIDAGRAWRKLERQAATEAVRQRLNDYAAEAYAAGHTGWADRFVSCSLDEGSRVIDDYIAFVERGVHA